MTTIRKTTMNSDSFVNLTSPKVIQHQAPETQEYKAEISFEKGQGLTFGSTESEKPEDTELSPEERRSARRDAWKEAEQVRRRAIETENRAKAKLAQTQNFEEIARNAKTNPMEVARALGIDPNEFYRLLSNQMLNIPLEPEVKPLSPEEEMKQRMERYEQERKREKEELESMKSQSIRNNYIQSKIIPAIKSRPDDFELLNSNGLEACANYIYDLMDSHYRETGEEWDPADVAAKMEEAFTAEFEEKIKQTKNYKKFSKHFRQDTDAPGQDINIPGQLGEDDTSYSEPEQSLGYDQPVSRSSFAKTSRVMPMDLQTNFSKQADWSNSRSERLKKAMGVLSSNPNLKK